MTLSTEPNKVGRRGFLAGLLAFFAVGGGYPRWRNTETENELPCPGNHVVLSSRLGPHGMPLARIDATQGAGDSPSLTIQALALRTGEALRRRAADGQI